MIINGRVGAAAGGSRERERAYPLALTTHEQLGACRDQARIGASDAEHEAGGELTAQHPEECCRVINVWRVHLHFTREHNLLQLACSDQLHSTRYRLLVVLWRHRARHLEATSGSGVQQRQRRTPKLSQPSIQTLDQLLDRVVRCGEHRQREVHTRLTFALATDDRDLGDTQRGRRKAPPVWCSSALVRKCEAPDGHRSDAVRLRCRIADRVRREHSPALGDHGEARCPRSLQRNDLAECRQGNATAIGLLIQEPRLPRATRGADHLGWVDVRGESDRDRGERLPPR